MSVEIFGEVYQVVRPYFVPLIYAVEGYQHGVTKLRNIDDGAIVTFRDIAPGPLDLQWTSHGYVIMSFNYRGVPVWFRANTDERFLYRAEMRNEHLRWDGLTGNFLAPRGDYQFFLPSSIFMKYLVPWEK